MMNVDAESTVTKQGSDEAVKPRYETSEQLMKAVYAHVRALGEDQKENLGDSFFFVKGGRGADVGGDLPEEYLSVSVDGQMVNFNSTTTKLNLMRPDDPEGAYNLEFTLTFSVEGLAVQYIEALPRRLQRFPKQPMASDYKNVAEFQAVIETYIQALQNILDYLGIDYESFEFD